VHFILSTSFVKQSTSRFSVENTGSSGIDNTGAQLGISGYGFRWPGLLAAQKHRIHKMGP